MNAEAQCGQDAPLRWELMGACPATQINITFSLGPFLGGFLLFNRRLPLLKAPGAPSRGFSIVCGNSRTIRISGSRYKMGSGDTAVSARISIMDPGAA